MCPDGGCEEREQDVRSVFPRRPAGGPAEGSEADPAQSLQSRGELTADTGSLVLRC